MRSFLVVTGTIFSEKSLYLAHTIIDGSFKSYVLAFVLLWGRWSDEYDEPETISSFRSLLNNNEVFRISCFAHCIQLIVKGGCLLDSTSECLFVPKGMNVSPLTRTYIYNEKRERERERQRYTTPYIQQG